MAASVPGLERSDSGMYLLELIMAIAASGVLAAALVGNMADTQRLSNAGQNQILAAAIAQEQIDSARNITYQSLLGMKGSYTLLVNKEGSGEVGPILNPRPLLLDLVSLDWTAAGKANKFAGTVIETIADGPYTDTLRVTVVSNWKEGTQNRSYSLSTLISRYGIHN